MWYISKYWGNVALAGLVLIGLGNSTYAETKSVFWTDPNYVPCEGLGATATGQVTASVDFTSGNHIIQVIRLQLHTEY